MSTALTIDEDVEVVPMELPLDRRTVRWLARLHSLNGQHPAEIVASMLRLIRIDDEIANEEDRAAHAQLLN